MARAVVALGHVSDRIARIGRELAELDLKRSILVSELETLHRDEAECRTAIIMAAIQRPPIDREVLRRVEALEMEGNTRGAIVKAKQNADRLWANPFDWSKISNPSGRMGFQELGHEGHERAHDLLPPSDNIALYIPDQIGFDRKVKALPPRVRVGRYRSALLTWIRMHYPAKIPHAEALATGWLALIMRNDPQIQTSDIWENTIIPNPWKAGSVVRLVIQSAS